jgi:hypothetical protein
MVLVFGSVQLLFPDIKELIKLIRYNEQNISTVFKILYTSKKLSKKRLLLNKPNTVDIKVANVHNINQSAALR